MLKRVTAAFICLTMMASLSAAQQTDFRDALRMTFPATVSISIPGQDGDFVAPPMFGNGFRGFQRQMRMLGGNQVQMNFGALPGPSKTSGFAISATKVLTQLSESADEVDITTFDQTKHLGKVIARDHVTGLAIIEVEDAALVSLVVGDGNPEAGLPVVTTWIANGVGMSKSAMVACPPNSSQPSIGFTQQLDTGGQMNVAGAPVVDAEGVLVGITVSAEDGSIVCMPAVQLNRLIDLGLGDQPSDLKRGLVGIQFSRDTGAVVNAVTSGSAAADAGLSQGDEITQVNDYQIRGYEDVLAAVAMARAGDAVQISFLRGDEAMVRTINLGEFKQPKMAMQRLPNNGNAIARQQAWKLEDGKLVPMDLDQDGGVELWAPPGMEQFFKDLNLDGLPQQFRLPPRLNGFQIERSDMEEKVKEQERKIQELNEKIRELEGRN